MSVSAKDLIFRAEEIAAEGPSYQQGHSGDDGYCDCIGLIIGAKRRAGGSWRGIHGSNYAARSETLGLAPIEKADQLTPGEVVYKANHPSEEKNRLPDRYKPGGESYNGDLMDYYHVGIVVSAKPLRIRHMTEPKPAMDTKLGKWKYHGKLRGVEYDQEKGGTVMCVTAKVVLPASASGDTVNVRRNSSKSASIEFRVPVGSTVEVLQDIGQWCEVRWDGRTGYMMSDFIEYGGDYAGETCEVSAEQLHQVDVALARIEELVKAIGEQTEVIGTIVGRG